MIQTIHTIRWLDHKPMHFIYNGKWISNWFSNMIIHPIIIEGRLWPSVENYYQAKKTDDKDLQDMIRNLSPSAAKREGRKLVLRPSWDQIKEHVMKHALGIKFSHRTWYRLLMATGNAPIIEWNNWGDQYWGVTEDGMGRNRLGILLMEIREKNKSPEERDPLLGLGMSVEQREKQ